METRSPMTIIGKQMRAAAKFKLKLHRIPCRSYANFNNNAGQKEDPIAHDEKNENNPKMKASNMILG